MQIEATPSIKIDHYEALCKLLSDQARIERTRSVDWDSFSPHDWHLFFQRARRERVAPLVYWKLQGTATNVPADVLNQFQLIYYQNLAHNELLFQELNRLLEALEKANIPVILLKGAALIKTVYPGIALRPMSDIDLMVPPEKLLDTIRVFKKAGYSQEKITYHAVMRGGPGNQVVMEIHWAIIPNKAPGKTAALDWFWENTQPAQDSPHARVFTPEAQLLYLVGHLMMQSHAEEMGLLWFYDMHLVSTVLPKKIEQNNLFFVADWLGWKNLLGAALQSAESKFRPGGNGDLDISFSTRKNFSEENFYIPTREIIKNAISLLDIRTRMVAFIGLLFPDPNYMRWRYHPKPSWLWIFYYIKRMLEMIGVL